MWTQTVKDEEWICKEKSVHELSDLCRIIIIIIITLLLLLLLLHFSICVSLFFMSVASLKYY